MAITKSSFPGPALGPLPPVWGRVPSRNKNFTGRAAHLEQLNAALNNTVTAVLPHALHGYGGVGKTLIAVEYAHQFRGDYDVVWWIMADQPGLVRSSLAHLAPHLNLPGPNEVGIDEAAANVLDSLRRGEPYDRWLLVFDNADEPEDLKDIIPQGPGHVLITSRNHRWQGVAEAVSLEEFSARESEEFLRKRIGRPIAAEEANELAEALGHLPLALEQAGALQAETGMSVQEYLRLLKEQPTSLMGEGKPPEYPASMAAAWRLSVAKLQENLPEAMDLLRSCAFFSPEPIPRDIFFPVDDGRVRPEMTELMADPIRLGRAIAQLGRYALIRLDANRTIQVHRLIQALVRDDIPRQEHEAIRSEVWSLMSAAEDEERYVELLPHLRSTRIAESTEPECRRFVVDVLRYLHGAGDLDSANALAEEFLREWTSVSGADDPFVLRLERTYAGILRDLGQYDKVHEIDRGLLPRMREVLGPTDRETLALLNGLGHDLRVRGDFRRALENDNEALRLYDEAMGPQSPLTMRATHNLAINYMLNSDFGGARSLHERAYMMARRLRGATPADTLLAYQNGIAQAVRLAGDYTEACDLGEDCLAFGQDKLQRDHPVTLRVQLTLAISRRMAGETDEAFELVQDVHSRYLNRYSLNHPETIAAAMCLANVLRMRGDLVEAMALAEDTYTRYERVYGAQHPYNFGCSTNVALLHRLLGDPSRARSINESALTALDEGLGRDHHITLGVAVNLAGDLATLGETKNAIRLDRGTLRRTRALLNEDHPLALTCAANLALDLRAEGDPGEVAEAEALHAEILPMFSRVLGREHPFTQAVLEGRRLSYDFDPPLL
ncbi:FxSxx-COOH system tetratricopeptide repeat protein [Nocardiopsis aegyptia]|uniref:Tetratricopeptide (TPR) repeat protein n=1 Tax=Nocardiopsis aegyptia TaxID=220378 RepID=A0A7Z0JDT4_9ACTN|nr:FxSxx-COOH system tetratricopeptide repeat protein [Nocardiopsis aegyptia]NYJ37830.1 tetratricopeptide (TPR) repeat protein [Nocardiopsis aegyptia]